MTLGIFDIAGRAMSAQLVRLSSSASKLANAGAVSGTAEGAYRPLKPVLFTLAPKPRLAPADSSRSKIC